MMSNVAPKKGITFDGIEDSWFYLCSQCYSQKGVESCDSYTKKREIVEVFTRKEYWSRPESADHLVARLVPLNKKFPLTPLVPEYRPIVVSSPVIKFLEGFIKPSLDKYSVSRMRVEQFAFIRGIGIEECRYSLVGEVVEQISSSGGCWVVFVDFSSAYEMVLRSKLFELLVEKNILGR